MDGSQDVAGRAHAHGADAKDLALKQILSARYNDAGLRYLNAAAPCMPRSLLRVGALPQFHF
jgi:hypothetical protein